jgi:hypothetical protein
MRKLPLAIFGSALLCASQAFAGHLGNGAAERGGIAPAPPVAKAHYSVCWGQWPRTSTAYFSTVITSASSLKNPSFEAAFRSYLHNTFGIGAAPQCFIALSVDEAVAAKKKQEASFGDQYKIVETNWTGVDVPGAASSLATPPAASANTGTSLPPVAQAGPDAAGAQVNGQIEQAGQTLLNKLFQH